MDVVSQIFELIGFDILFLGGITLFTGSLAVGFWQHPHFSAAPFVSCLANLRRLFESGTPFFYAVVTAVAALLGMLINLSGDRILDNECLVHRIPTFTCRALSSEDELKLDALKSATHLFTTNRIADILRNHSGSGAAEAASSAERDRCSCERGPNLDPAKSLMQHAYAVVQRADDGKAFRSLRYELLVVKVLRVLLVLVIVLYVVVFSRMIVPPAKTRWKTRIATAVIASVLAVVVSELVVSLWMAQSKRYYRKLIHAYIVLIEREDKALDRIATPPTAQP